MRHAPIDYYFTPEAKAHLEALRVRAESRQWHDKEVAWMCQMAVRFGFRYELAQSGDPGQT